MGFAFWAVAACLVFSLFGFSFVLHFSLADWLFVSDFGALYLVLFAVLQRGAADDRFKFGDKITGLVVAAAAGDFTDG